MMTVDVAVAQEKLSDLLGWVARRGEAVLTRGGVVARLKRETPERKPGTLLEPVPAEDAERLAADVLEPLIKELPLIKLPLIKECPGSPRQDLT